MNFVRRLVLKYTHTFYWVSILSYS